MKVISSVISAVTYVHTLGWVIGDIKPKNIFITNGDVFDLGDFGGAVPINSQLVEFTPDFLPADLVDQPASPAHDKMCILSTALHLLNKKPTGIINIASLRGTVQLVEYSPLKDLLSQLF